MSNTHGGKREGAGRKPIATEIVILAPIRLPKSMFEKMPKPYAKYIRDLIERDQGGKR